MINFVTIFALLVHGILPGMVLCEGEEGHVAIETALEWCCSSFVPTAPNSSRTLPGYELESAARDSCGPCSDTFISTAPFAFPTAKHPLSLIAVQAAMNVLNDIAVGAKVLLGGNVNPTQIALVPIRTTVLLL